MNIIEKIQLLVKARKPIEELVIEIKEAKRGYRTVSFWLTVICSLLSLAAVIQGIIPATIGLCLTTALTVIYNILRGLQKSDEIGIRPVFQSTEFWIGVLNSISNGFVALQTGGVNPEWLAATQIIITSAIGMAQNLAGHQPENK